MRRCGTIGICFLLGFSLLAIDFRGRARAAEPLPDSSVLAYRGSRPKPPPQPRVSDVTLTGTISSMESNGLKIKASKTSSTKDQVEWLVTAAEGTQVTIRGTASQDFLRKGQVVEFSAEVVSDEKSTEKVKTEKVASPVSELTIVCRKKTALTTPSSKKAVAAKDNAADAGIGGRIEAAKPAEDPDSTLAADDNKDASKPAAGGAAKSKAKAGAKTKIVARVESVGSKSITVTAGERTIRVELSDSPTIKLEMTNPKIIPNASDITKTKIEGSGAGGKLVSLIAKDLVSAKIVAHGTGVESQTNKSDRQCAAKNIVVTLTTPLKAPASATKTASDK